MHRTKGVPCRLETLGFAVDVFGLDGPTGIVDLRLHLQWPVADAAQELFEFVRYSELIVIKMGV